MAMIGAAICLPLSGGKLAASTKLPVAIMKRLAEKSAMFGIMKNRAITSIQLTRVAIMPKEKSPYLHTGENG